MNDKTNDKTAVDLETFAKEGKKIPKDCKLFRIRIDREKYLVQQAALTGAELLQLADKDPNEYRILYKGCGGKPHIIPLDTNFSFLNPGVERFMTQKIRAQEG